MRPLLRVTLAGEDSGGDAHEVRVALAWSALRLAAPGLTRREVLFQALDPGVAAVAHGNLWKAAKPRSGMVALRQALARSLVERDPPHLVLWHVDGDCPWSQRDGCENVAQFDQQVIQPVMNIVGGYCARQPALDLGVCRSLLVPMVSYYSIESWLFQAFDVYEQLVREQLGRVPEAVGHALERWRSDRKLLDEHEKPKELVGLKKGRNLKLAQAFPASEVKAAGTSYAAFVQRLARCEAARDAPSRRIAPA